MGLGNLASLGTLMTSKPATLANQTPTVKMLLDGKFVDSHTSEWHDVVNPATQEVLAVVPFATDQEIEAAIASAKQAFKTWKNTPLAARARIMLKLQELVRQHMSRIARTLSAEQGKTLADAEGDVFRGLEVVEHACSIGSLQLGEFAENVAGGVDTYTLRQPIGVCAGITPFNFPAMIPLWMFPMAIVCGNTFVLKPSEQDPLTPMLLAELALEAGVPPGVLNIVHGGKRAVDALCTHPDIAAVSFVGSTAVGTHVYGLASQHGKRVQCMMGAKNHAVVMPDAHKEQSLNALVGATFGAAGAPTLHGDVGDRTGRRGAQLDTGHRCQGEDSQGQCRQRERRGFGPCRLEKCQEPHSRIGGRRHQGRRQARVGRPQHQSTRLRAGQFHRSDHFFGCDARHENLHDRDLRTCDGHRGRGHAERRHYARQRQPVRQRHRHIHAKRRSGAQISE